MENTVERLARTLISESGFGTFRGSAMRKKATCSETNRRISNKMTRVRGIMHTEYGDYPNIC
jgi:hypothetical protein